MLFKHENPFSCHDARRLMAFMSDNDPDLSLEERESFEQHIRICPSCAAEYEEDKQLAALLRQHWPISDDTKKLLQSAGQDVETQEDLCTCGKPYRPMTVEEGWEDLKRRCPSLAEACRRDERKRKLRRMVWRIGNLAVAACILIAVGVGFLALRNNGSDQLGLDAAMNQNGSPVAYAELVTAKGREPLALNRPITTGDQPCEILLGGMHRVVMNRNAKATFSANSAQTGKNANNETPVYNIQLAGGELYVEVVPGHPFVVNTANAQLDITGTKFDVRAEDDRTDLTLLKGSVRFSRHLAANATRSTEAFVNVTAGYTASVIGQAAPTAPRKTYALAATAWARNLVLSHAVATAYPDENLHLLESIQGYWPRSQMPDLDSIDYVQWREEHREWFQREFPWIFQAADALKQHKGLDADYIELLMVSGDIWQFHYPRTIDQPIPVFNAAGIKQIAAYYGVEPAALLAAIAPANADINEQSLAQAAEEYHKAMQNWQSAIASLSKKEDRDASAEKHHNDVLLFSLRAGRYLTNTRTAAWTWAQAHPAEAAKILTAWRRLGLLPAESQTLSFQDWLNTLRREIAATDDIARLASELITAPPVDACDSQTKTLTGRLNNTIRAFLSLGRMNP